MLYLQVQKTHVMPTVYLLIGVPRTSLFWRRWRQRRDRRRKAVIETLSADYGVGIVGWIRTPFVVTMKEVVVRGTAVDKIDLEALSMTPCALNGFSSFSKR